MNDIECMIWIFSLFILGFIFTVLIVAYVAGERGVHDLFLTYIPHLSHVAIKIFEAVTTVVIRHLAVLVGQLAVLPVVNIFSERIETWLLSKSLFYIFCLIMMLGWWYDREEMKAMVGSIVAEVNQRGCGRRVCHPGQPVAPDGLRGINHHHTHEIINIC